MTRLVGGGHSDVGRVRSNNQDAALSGPGTTLFAVADGMGGHRGGEVASAMALRTLSEQVSETRSDGVLLDSVETLIEAMLEANERVFDEARTNTELSGMGTTLCAVALIGPPGAEQVAVTNVGDSRVYVLHDGELTQLTEDHSLVQSLVRDGQLTADEAAVHPQRNILTRVIGVEPDVEVDWWEWPALLGDRYLLCSDGLFNEVSDAKIGATLRQLADPTEAAKTLVALANAGGGRDNVTCVVVDVVDDADGRIAPNGTIATDGRVASDGSIDGSSLAASGAAPATLIAGPADPGASAARDLAEALADAPPSPEPRARRFTLRVLVFVAVLVALAAAAVIAIRTWARHNYFVAANGDTVAIYRGRPDGVLWFDPELVERTDVTLSRLTDVQRALIEEGFNTSSPTEAQQWVTRLTTPTTAARPVTTTTTATETTPTTVAGATDVAPTGASTDPTTVAGTQPPESVPAG